jgi:hypothetical protein
VRPVRTGEVAAARGGNGGAGARLWDLTPWAVEGEVRAMEATRACTIFAQDGLTPHPRDPNPSMFPSPSIPLLPPPRLLAPRLCARARRT